LSDESTSRVILAGSGAFGLAVCAYMPGIAKQARIRNDKENTKRKARLQGFIKLLFNNKPDGAPRS
jgi:hypothetical protein